MGGVLCKDGEGYMGYIQRVAPLHIARAVKIADLTDNLSPSRRGALVGRCKPVQAKQVIVCRMGRNGKMWQNSNED